MQDRLKQTLAQAAAAGLAVDLTRDWDALRRLDDLAAAILTAPASGPAQGLWHPAVTVGNLTLYRLTPGARWFLAARVAAWYADDPAGATAAQVWTLAHVAQPRRLRQYLAETDRAAFAEEVARWSAALRVLPLELHAALRELYPPPAPDPAPEAPTHVPDPDRPATRPTPPLDAAVLGVLATEFGIPPAEAIWQRTEDEIAVLLEGTAERARREAGRAPDPDAPLVRAIAAYAREEAAFLARLREIRAQGGADHEVRNQPLRSGQRVPGQPAGPAQTEPRRGDPQEEQPPREAAAEHPLSPAGDEEARVVIAFRRGSDDARVHDPEHTP
jgi:hypothetical protein